MSRSERLQDKERVNYALLNKGLSSVAPVNSTVSSDSVKPLETNTPMNTVPTAEASANTEIVESNEDLDAEIAELELIEKGLEAKNQRRERLARRDALLKRIKVLESVEAPESSGLIAAPVLSNVVNSPVNNVVKDQLQLPVPVSSNDVSLKDLRNISQLNDQVDAQLSRYGLVYNDTVADAKPTIYQTTKIHGKDYSNDSIVSNNIAFPSSSQTLTSPVFPPNPNSVFLERSPELEIL